MSRFSGCALVALRSPSGAVVRATVATTFAARLLGLAGVARLPGGHGLLIPHCRSVHTLGMRIAIDVVFLRGSTVVDVRAHVRPGRFVRCRQTPVSVLEVGAGEAARLGLARGTRLREREG